MLRRVGDAFKEVLFGHFAGEILSDASLRIDLVLRKIAQSPLIYSMLSEQVLPHAKESVAFERRWTWLIYLMLVVFCGGWLHNEQNSTVVDSCWMLVAASAVGFVVAFFRLLPGVIDQALARVKFSNLLVIFLRGDLALRVSAHAENVAPIWGDGEQARPLKLRI